MNAVDTNVFVYSLDRNEPMKQLKAWQLLRSLRSNPIPTILLWQVAGELLRQLRGWQDQGRIPLGSGRRYIGMARSLFPLTMPTPAVLDRALDLADRYSLSHWDSMLLGACLEAGVDTLFTEDMGAPTRIDKIQLINPFI